MKIKIIILAAFFVLSNLFTLQKPIMAAQEDDNGGVPDNAQLQTLQPLFQELYRIKQELQTAVEQRHAGIDALMTKLVYDEQKIQLAITAEIEKMSDDTFRLTKNNFQDILEIINMALPSVAETTEDLERHIRSRERVENIILESIGVQIDILQNRGYLYVEDGKMMFNVNHNTTSGLNPSAKEYTYETYTINSDLVVSRSVRTVKMEKDKNGF